MPAPGATLRSTRPGAARTTTWRCSPLPRQVCSALSMAAMSDITASPRNSSVAMVPIGWRQTGRTANFKRTRSPTSSASIHCSNICWRCPADARRPSASPGIAVPPHPVGNVGSTCMVPAIAQAKGPRTIVPWSMARPRHQRRRRRRSWNGAMRPRRSTRAIQCTGPAATTTGTPAAPSVTARTCRNATTRTRARTQPPGARSTSAAKPATGRVSDTWHWPTRGN